MLGKGSLNYRKKAEQDKNTQPQTPVWSDVCISPFLCTVLVTKCHRMLHHGQTVGLSFSPVICPSHHTFCLLSPANSTICPNCADVVTVVNSLHSLNRFCIIVMPTSCLKTCIGMYSQHTMCRQMQVFWCSQIVLRMTQIHYP